MKKNIICLLLITWSVASFSQQTTTSKPPLTKADYLKKSKSQKTGAWLLVGGGVAMMAIALTIPIKESNDPFVMMYNGYTGGGAILSLIGALSALGSIPLFIASARNKRVANRTTAFFKMEAIPVVGQTGFVSRPYPALAIKINL